MASQQPQAENINDSLNLKNRDTNQQSQDNAANATKLQNGQTAPAQTGQPTNTAVPATSTNSPISEQKNINSPSSNGNGAGVNPNESIGSNNSSNSGPPNQNQNINAYDQQQQQQQHSQGMPPQPQMQQQGPPHNPMDQKDDGMMGQPPQHHGGMPPQMHHPNHPPHQQQNIYGHPPMNMPPHHPMHPSQQQQQQQHMPPHHLPPHHHQQYSPQQRYHPQQQQQQQQQQHGYPMHPQHDPNQQMPPNAAMGNDPYSHHYRSMMGGKPGMMPVRPPQRYLPPQSQQGPPGNQQIPQTGQQPGMPGPQQGTPTLNSLLQSQPPNQGQQVGSGPGQPNQQGPPPPPQPGQQQQQQQPPQVQGPPPPQHRGYPNAYDQSPYSPPIPPQQQQSWAPPRPYSPQQGYRGAPPSNNSRGQSPYPPQPGQSPGPYPMSPAPGQQPGQQPPGIPGNTPQQGGPQSQQQPPTHQPPQQYYPQRYPTPPSGATQPIGPPNHRSTYPTHQWPSPAASPGPMPGQHPHGPPQSQSPHPHGPPPSPSQHSAPSPSPQPPPPQPAQSPHQYPNRPSQPTTPNTIDNEMGASQKRNNKNKVKKTKKQQRQEAQGQMNNESNANSGQMSGANANQPPVPPPQSQSMRPIGSPNSSSSGSRSMSPAVGGQQPPRPSSSHSQMPNQPPISQPPTGGPLQNQMNSNNPASNVAQTPGPGQPLMEGGASGMTSPGRPPSSGPPSQQIPPQQQNYQGPPMPQGQPPHMMGGYKMGGPSGPQGPMGGYPPQSQYSQQGNYSPRPQYPNYGPPPSNNMSPSHQYGGRPMPNHVGGPPGSHPGQYPYQNWPPPPPPQSGINSPGMMPNHIQGGKNIGPPQSQSPQSSQQPPQSQPGQQQGSPAQSPQHQGAQQQIGPGPGPQRQLGYLKQHLQHKGGYAGSQSPTPPGPPVHPSQMQGYGNGPGMHPPSGSMGPPHHMGPPMGPPVSSAPSAAAPPSMGGPNHMENTQMGPINMPPHHSSEQSQDNGPPGSVTSIVTTGPDGTTLDEGSQQSTLSNTSIASGEDQVPKSRKSDFYGPPHMTPNASNASASPGPGHTPQHNEDFEMGSPTWPRPPASPVFNSHVPPATESYRSTKKSDSLAKLYEMDDNPDRRIFLDKLLGYMEELRKPISACPTISKQPLDLYKLYVYVKERGGFSEVCKVTKSKTWKDIAGLLGIGASSSAAYTLRKHYIKNILPYECQFDRGGIDPLPIIQSIETGAKKKQAKQSSVPSPGSSNSQDSFPAPGSGGGSMDGYSGYPGNYPPTPGQQPDYSVSPMPRPSSQSNAQSPHTGNPPPSSGDNISVSNPFEDPVGPSRVPYQHQQQGAPYPSVSRPQGTPYQGQGQYNYMPPDQYGPAGQYPPQQNQYPPNSNRGMYPHYGPPEADVNMPPNSGPPAAANDPYRYSQPGPGGYPMPPQQMQSQRPPYGQPPVAPQQSQQPQPQQQPGPPPQNIPPAQPSQSIQPPQQPPLSQAGPMPQPTVPTTSASPSVTSTPPASGQQQPPISQHQPITAQAPSQPTPGPVPSTQAPAPQPGMGPGPQNPPYQGQGPPPQPDYYRQDQPRRHPDFTKDPATQTYPPYGPQRPQMYGGWPNSAQYRGQYPQGGPPPAQQWQGGPGQRPPMPSGGISSGGWDNRYPPNQQPYSPHQSNQQWSGGMPGSPQRPPSGGQRGGGKPFAMPPPQASGPGQPGSPMNKMQGQYPGQYGPQNQQMIPQHPHHPHHPHHSPHMQQVGPHPHPGQQQQPHHPQSLQPQQGGVMQTKRDIVFPQDSVEATTPLLYRRKRYTKMDIGQVDPWRIFMALRSGLLAESTWALDVLNILLFDDTTVTYFGLTHLPGLLNLLLEHFQKSLSDMFDGNKKQALALTDKNGSSSDNNKLSGINNNSNDNTSVNNSEKSDNSCKNEIDLGSVTDIPNPDDRIIVLKSTSNYTMQSRKGVPVKMQDASSDIFIMDNQKDWDKMSNKNYYITASLGDDPWTMGQQEPNTCEYIMDCFKAEFVNIPFARFIKSNNNNKNNNNNNRNKSPGNHNTTDSKDKDDIVITSNNNDNNLNNNNSNNNNKTNKMDNDIKNVSDQLNSMIKNSSDNKHRTSNSKIMRLNDDILKERCVSASVKKESIDSDCRQVDMELEKSLPNGPSASNNGENSSDSNDNKVKAENEIKEEAEAEEKGFNLKSTVKDPAKVLKRRRMSDYEDECYTRDEASLYLVAESQDSLARRCICLSTILRNLTFVPGNELEFARSPVFLSILGKLLLIHHEHPVRTKKQRNYDREEDADFTDSCSSLQGEQEWWWDYITQIRENMLVSLANIAGHLELCNYDEFISRPVLDGLLHWAVCPSAHGQDPFPTLNNLSSLSPQRLALEALCKLCVTDANVDLVIATPPFSRLEKLCAVLTRQLCKNEDQVLREFSVNLLHYLAAADSTMARTVAKQNPCVSYLVAFIEQAEQTALGVANNHGINFLRENPDSMGTSLDMLRRAAGTLLHLAKHPDNRPLFMQQEQRLLGLVMSHILDQQVALIISRVLFQCSRGPGPLTTTPHEPQNFSLIPGCTSFNIPQNSPMLMNKNQPPMTMNPMQHPFSHQSQFIHHQQSMAMPAQNQTPNLRYPPVRYPEDVTKNPQNKLNAKQSALPIQPPVSSSSSSSSSLATPVPAVPVPATATTNPAATVSPATNIQQTVTASS